MPVAFFKVEPRKEDYLDHVSRKGSTMARRQVLAANSASIQTASILILTLRLPQSSPLPADRPIVHPNPARAHRIEILGGLAFGAIAFAGIWQLLIATDKQSFLFGCLLLMIGGAAILWPFLRRLEPHGLRFTHLKSHNSRYTGILVPVSLAERILTGSILLGSAVIVLNLNTSEHFNQIEAWYAAGLSFFCLFILIATTIQNKPAILLTTEGVVWHQAFTTAAFIPWHAILLATTFNNIVQFTSTPCFGLVLDDLSAIDASPRRRESASMEFAQTGCHFVYVSENLLYPSERLAQLINYYIVHPHRRLEISNGVTISRIPEIVNETGIQIPRQSAIV